MSEPRIVTEVGEWFLNSHSHSSNGDGGSRQYQVDYRWAICYSLLNFLHPTGGATRQANTTRSTETLFDSTGGKKVLENLRQALSAKTYWVEEGFIEVFPFEAESNGDDLNGYVVVDKADGMYPLVLYSSSGRDTAYREALDDVIQLYDEIYPHLSQAGGTGDWDEDFQSNKIAKIPWNYAPEAVSLEGS